MTKRFVKSHSLMLALLVNYAALAAEIDFSRDIRPILSDTCFECHGPDSQAREADLRLDTKEGAFAELDGHRAIVPEKLDESELYRRITSTDPDERMPPPDSKRRLTEQQIVLIRKWIEQGASWQQHWSFVTPTRPLLPKVSRRNWCRNTIDNFILSRLDRERLVPSPATDKATLIRRVSLDLTGLPPTQSEIDAFVADNSHRAYERVVDRLLKSPRYGERMAIRWLDAARYADTSGYQNDGPRYMWRWRDWVIDAYNKNMPFDQFTIEQLAGDLLVVDRPLTGIGEVGPRAPIVRDETTRDLLIASAFNRNHRGNAEGGIVPEEYQVEYVVDRVDTTATVWLGLTMGCARCHDHKYDPISQKEFYRFFAYFNNVPEYGRAIKEGNSPPYIKAPTKKQLDELKRAEFRLAKAETRMENLEVKIKTAQKKWEASVAKSEPVAERTTIEDGLVFRYSFDEQESKRSQEDSNKSGSPQARIENGKSTTAYVEGVQGDGNAFEFDGKLFVNAGDVAKIDYFDKFSLSGWVRYPKDGTIISRMTRTSRGDGYYVHLRDGHVQVNFVKRWLDDSIRVETVGRVQGDQWHHIAVTYDGSRVAKGITVYFDGEPQELKVHHDFLNQTFANDEPLRIGAGHSIYRGWLDEIRVYNRALTPHEIQLIAVPQSINRIVSIPTDKRTRSQLAKLREHFLRLHSPKQLRDAYNDVHEARNAQAGLLESLPTIMVMWDMKRPRQTSVLVRGEYNKPSEKVTPDVPAVFPPRPSESPNNRLGLARWLVHSANPLTPRVAVNRYWQMYFGKGLVASVEDFGSQGARPTHPKLLDWLAVEFVNRGWNVKHMQKLIVMSATYRQSSRMTDELFNRDPMNALLARGPRLRLSAETIRDQALAVSGLLHETLGGPSVKPYQPAGLWNEIASDKNYDRSSGSDLYRRSLYTYWKRTVAPPTMSTFDAPNRESCIVRQTRTNTPLQALALMNDVTYVEAARALAQRMLLEGGSTLEERVAWGFRQVTCRVPTDRETEILTRRIARSLKRFQSDPKAASELLAVGEFRAVDSIDPSTLAAYAVAASMILNLDETVSKQ